jgi:F0F1-type ATP synthase assembly protein I
VRAETVAGRLTADALQPFGDGRYSVTPPSSGQGRRPEDHSSTSVETVAFLLLAGVAVGGGVGLLVDWLAGTLPLFLVIGVFAGFALALYALYLETK